MGSLLALLKFFASPIGRMVGAALVTALIVGPGAWRTANKLSDARWYKAQAATKDVRIKQLQTQITAVNTAAGNDKERASAAEAARAKAEKRANDIIASQPPDLGPGAPGGLSDAFSDGVRGLWPPAVARGPRNRPAADSVGPYRLFRKTGPSAAKGQAH